MSLLTYQDIIDIAAVNESFKVKHQTFGNTTVAQCTYFLASSGDFFDAKKDGSMLRATELRGITFVNNGDGVWHRYLFLDKFFNVGQTNGTDKTFMELTINGVTETVNINKLFSLNGEKVYRAIDLKIGMEVGEFNRADLSVGPLTKIVTLEKVVLPTAYPENSWMYHDIKDLEVDRIADKEDGSAIRFLIINGELVAKTKFSFESEQTGMAMAVVNANPRIKAFIMKTLEDGIAALFEIVSPFNKIVLSYKDTTLKLLQMRDEVTGEYLNIYRHPLVEEFNISTAENYDIDYVRTIANSVGKDEVENLLGDNKFESLTELLVFLDNSKSDNNGTMSILDLLLVAKDYVENKEGWVIHFKQGEMGKMGKSKTTWYMNLHSILSDGLKENIIIGKVLDETIDDTIAAIPEENVDERSFIDDITEVVVKHVNTVATEVFNYVKENYKGDRKEFAMANKHDPRFHFMMRLTTTLDYEIVEKAVADDIAFKTRKLEKAKTFLRELGFTRELKVLEDDN